MADFITLTGADSSAQTTANQPQQTATGITLQLAENTSNQGKLKDETWNAIQSYLNKKEAIDKELQAKVEELKNINQALEDKMSLLKLDIEQKTSDITTKVTIAEQKIEDGKVKVIETLGIFVALFTFISVDFAAFKNNSVIDTASLTLILAGVLLLFILVMDLVIRYWRYEWEVKDEIVFHWKKHFVMLAALSVGLILTGLILIVEKNLNNNVTAKNQIPSNLQNFVTPTASASASPTE